MRAVRFEAFGGPLAVQDVPPPVAGARGAVLAVEASGLCRSDVHAWAGHDASVRLPHVPGHELVGRVVSVGSQVAAFGVGQRVTAPFVCACGRCPECASGNGQVCRNQTQPGFTHDGSFAELVRVEEADENLVAVPEDVDAGAAALLGCRFATAYRGLVLLARVRAGEAVLVVGCGGVGLSAVMVAVALGARVVAVDVDAAALQRAASLGAAATIDSSSTAPEELDAALRQVHPDGVQVSVEALGRAETIDLALRSLAARGRHVQIGLVPAEPVVRVSRVVSHELVLLGVHGMSARDYPGLVALVASGRLRPQDLVGTWIGLDDVPAAMAATAQGRSPAGVTMIRP
ncbi:alcohol dehydrogenase catalytic domain-containing protein [Quadrisphaera sp. DSM 44207]|uniref:zinc-binding dehydrogenase n=1 Tax=Quadrisphaera sp. DSM 44207 TaxID=1881057 RepID=UPI0008808AE8|nr:alcohol dehydrogenase catalytic domain-containing protein [Quadrisphaera sp. DSM 44207]SDQ77433.1 alcohol dehydrogenase [Quadrisphaera sp. DSM 44207]